VVLALDLLTDNNITHRDIKPENIFINNNIMKLGDFGFAAQKDLCGTSNIIKLIIALKIF
jgi:serine/threonine protein kinase